MNKKQKEQYITLPIWFIKLTSNKKSPFYLTPFERELYSLIKGLCLNNKNSKKQNLCYADDEYFTGIFNVTIKHVNKSIHKLEGRNMIRIDNEKNKRFISCINIADAGTGLVFINDSKDYILTTVNNVYKIPNELTEQERGNIINDIIFNKEDAQRYSLK